MNNLTHVPSEKLRNLIAETESTLTELKAEMDRRDEAAQFREVDRLSEHMEAAVVSLQTVRDFYRKVIEELKAKP